MSRTKSACATVAALLVGFCAIPVAAFADPIPSQMTFTTTGPIGTTGVDGAPMLSFEGVTSGSLTTGTPFNLGTLVISPPTTGAWSTYAETPFQINVTIDSLNGQPLTNGPASFAIDGAINTTTNQGLQASLNIFAPASGSTSDSFPADSPILFQIGTSSFDLYPTASLFNLGQAGSANTPVTVRGEVDALNTPEPSTFLIFGMVGAVALLRRSRWAGS
jgi:PEP-CTERM motif